MRRNEQLERDLVPLLELFKRLTALRVLVENDQAFDGAEDYRRQAISLVREMEATAARAIQHERTHRG